MRLYHATSAINIEAVMTDGLRKGAYLTNSPEQAEYYAETIADEGQTPVIIELELSDLLSAVGDDHIFPDHASIAEPITSTLELTEDEVHEAWSEAEGTWRDSLEIVSCIRVEASIPARILHCEEYLPSFHGR
jgi:hypothetical protein